MLRLLSRLSPLALAVLAVGAVAQGPAAVRFERADGVESHLPQSSVYEILEDRRGFLWFATREGLGRWDGYTMRTWRRTPFDPASLPGNVVRRLLEDGRGDLWVLTQRTDRSPTGVARLVGPDHETVRRYGHPDARLFLGPDAAAWLVDADSLYRFDAAADRFRVVRVRIARDALSINGGYATRDGTLWIPTAVGLEAYPPGPGGAATGGASVVRPDVSWGTFEDPSFTPFGTLAEDPGGTLWVGGVRLGRLDAARRRIETMPVPLPEILGYGTGFGLGAIVPADGVLWLGTLDGVYRYDPATGALTRHSLRLPGDIPTQNWVTALHRDRAGTLWAGTVWGLHRALARPPPFRLLAHNPDDPNTLGSGIVMAIHQDARGVRWVGTLGGGLNRIAPDGRVTRYRHDPDDPATLGNDWVWSLASDGERLWIGTGDGLNAIRLDQPARVTRLHFRPDPANRWGPSAIGLHLDAGGTLWFGHDGGLNRLSPDGTRRVTPVPEGTAINAIRTVPGGAWLATTRGLLRYDAARDAFRTFRHDPDDPTSLSDDAVITVYLDRDHVFWVGTQSGLNRYDAATGGFTHYTSADGLPSDVVYAMLDDDDGHLWVSTNRGLARLDRRAPERMRAFTTDDGVGNVEFNSNAASRGLDGTFYFGGDRGVTVFDPRAVRANPYRPRVVITALHRATRDGTRTDRYVAGAADIAPDEDTFSFEFAALGFTNPPRQQYAVMMEGWDDGWVALGTQRRATYTNLPPGRYTFRVRAANEDGLWNATGAAVAVVVRPWFWQTWAFRAFVGLLVLGAVAGGAWAASRARYRRELARLEARRALEAERARISRDVHDEVGASLTEIAILSELARRTPGAGTATHLDRIAATSRAMIGALGEIVWAVNPKNDRLPALAAYLREHAAQYLETAGLEARLAFPQPVPDRPVSAELRRNVFLVLKEALHNVVKHAGATHAEVALAVTPGRLLLTIHDDGCGFALPEGDGAPPAADGAPARASGGNGLGNLRRRAAEVGGVLTVESAPRRGTTVRLAVPLSAPMTVRGRPAAVVQHPPSV